MHDIRNAGAVLWCCAVVAAIAVLATGCTGGGEGSPAGNGDRVGISCGGISALESYRYTVKIELSSGATPTAMPSSAEGASPSPTKDPLTALSEALSGLFADFTIQGAYVAPDRTQALLQFQGEEVELRSIGERWWLRHGPRWQEEALAAAVTGDLLTPLVVCEKIVSPIAAGLSGPPEGQETVGFVRTDRYRLSASDISGAGPLRAAVSGDYAVDLWLAHEGRWPARLLVQSRAGGAGGETFRLSMEVTDVGSDEIEIVQPIADY